MVLIVFNSILFILMKNISLFYEYSGSQKEAEHLIEKVKNDLKNMGFEESHIEVAIHSVLSIDIEILVQNLTSTGKFCNL